MGVICEISGVDTVLSVNNFVLMASNIDFSPRSAALALAASTLVYVAGCRLIGVSNEQVRRRQRRVNCTRKSHSKCTREDCSVLLHEWQMREQLAAMYRIAGKFGWDELIYNHITLRVNEGEVSLGCACCVLQCCV